MSNKLSYRDLAECIMFLVSQFMCDGDVITHSFMSAEEDAIDVLERLNLAENCGRERYKLLWENLDNLPE